MDEDGPYGSYMRKALEFGIVTPAQWMRMMGFEVSMPRPEMEEEERRQLAAKIQVALRLESERDARQEASWAAMRERWKDEADR